MRLILLPGMDGTGELFAPLLSHLRCDYSVVPLPLKGEQDYDVLVKYVERQLLQEDCVVLAESFSGPIAATLIQRDHPQIKGVIFAATFISTLSDPFLRLVQILPLKKLLKLPLSTYAVRGLFLGDADSTLVEKFRCVIDGVSAKVLRDRIGAIRHLRMEPGPSALPALYIQAKQDRLVPARKWCEFEPLFERIEKVSLDGPHAILQYRPQECAEAIDSFIDQLTRSGKED